MHLKDNLYLYRRHASSLTETKKASIKEQTYKALEKNFLPLYADAKEHGLSYAFFDQLLVRAEAHVEETKKLLFLVDRGYEQNINRRRMKVIVKETIRSSALYKMFQKSKGISC